LDYVFHTNYFKKIILKNKNKDKCIRVSTSKKDIYIDNHEALLPLFRDTDWISRCANFKSDYYRGVSSK